MQHMPLPYKAMSGSHHREGLTEGNVCKIVTNNYYKVTESVRAHYKVCLGENSAFTN